jgi:hypothetical protein
MGLVRFPITERVFLRFPAVCSELFKTIDHVMQARRPEFACLKLQCSA